MINDSEIYRQIKKINSTKIGSCNVLYIKPGAKIPKHCHKNLEIEYVYRGNCQTHKKGKIYIWQSNQPHELINDSKKELVVICLKIPPYSAKEMRYI